MSYGVEQIKSLEGLDAIRERPAMYIGTTSQQGINQIIYEVWDNSLDEFSAGYGNEIDIIIDKDNYITITDKGRGIPVGPHPEWKNEDGTPMNTLTGVLTKLHAGGKFNRDGSSGYFNGSTGTYGIGSKATNALSDDFIVTVKRDGKAYQQTFSKGKPTSEVKIIGKAANTGTSIKFHPDKEIFKETIVPNDKRLQSRLHEITALNANLKINYKNELAKVDKQFYYPNGISDYIKNELLQDKKLLFEIPLYYKGNYSNEEETMTAEISFIYQDSIEDNQIIKTFANNITTREHGTHLQGFKDGFKDCINEYGIKNKLISSPIEIKYLLDNICLVVSVHLKECELEGQTKNKLGNTIAKDGLIQIVKDFFKSLDKSQKAIINIIITRANAVKEAEEAARKARINSRKANKITKIALPGKLADCSNNKGYSEIFYCLKGNTKIKLLDGTTPTIKSLVGKQSLWAYSLDENNKVIAGEIKGVFKTQEVTQMIKITFTDDSVVECTPEHRFLNALTNQWVQAKDISKFHYLYNIIKDIDIKDIEQVEYKEPIPMYCLIIDTKSHAFALDNGIITHNCEGMSAAGCFVGDTLIQLVDGRSISISQLVVEHSSKKNYVYSSDKNGKVCGQPIVNAFQSKIAFETVKITLDNNEVVECTPEHLFMLRDGTYKQAQLLTPQDNLMVLGDKITFIKEVSLLSYPNGIEVYDLTVPPYNNFALSAGIFVHNSAKSARDSSYQAIMPLRGKILNTEKADFEKAITSDTAKAFIASIGTGIGKQFDITKCRYDKIIMMCDADIDGFHISNLILTLIYNYMRPLISEGYVYNTVPPLYKIITKKQSIYLKDDTALKEYRKQHKNEKFILQRFKGLGEMDYTELWETTMNPETRTLKRITIEDAEEMTKAFDVCMGKDVNARRKFIEENAYKAIIVD